MEKVKNTGVGTLAFKDDKGIIHNIKEGEIVECPYKKSQDPRLVIQSETKKKETKKKEEI